MKENLKGKMENSVDYRIFLQGNIFYIRLKAFARERQKDGNVTIEGYIQNITDIQKRRNDINLLTHAINNSTEDIYSAHEDGTLIFCNRCFKERHGIGNGQDITRMKIYDLPHTAGMKHPGKSLPTVSNVERRTTDTSSTIRCPSVRKYSPLKETLIG